MPNIDELQIEITTKAKQVDDTIDVLVKKLDLLSGSLKNINKINTSGLKKVANNFNNINKTTSSMASGLSRVNISAQKTTKSFGGLASSIGKFYATWFFVIRGVKSLGKSVESTADYIEAFNYFNVALGKIGSDWSNQFEKYGYENAEAYAESFSQRLQQDLSGLSGLAISTDASGNGLLSSTGTKNLGLNIKEITQFASQLASVTNSVGQTGEVSLATANAFTKLSADISSLFNLDYSSVMKNLQSGLIGQSRALYKYGIDITNATLQTYAYELGLSKAVSEMTQAEKMQLRMIAILDQSKVSWGDLANTINSPSNMLRQFSNNLKEAGMVLGQLFIPLMQKGMPVINGITIAIKNLLTSIAGFFGIKLDLSSFGQGFSGIEEDVDGTTDSLDQATESAKKLRKQLQPFDNLNLITTPTDSGALSSGGIGGGIDLTQQILDATAEYERVWQEAFDRMENQAEVFSKKVEKALEPVKSLFQNIAIGDWFAVGQDVSTIVVGINEFLTRAIANVDWQSVGNNIGLFLSGIDFSQIFSSFGKLFWEGINAGIDQWKGIFEVAPIETTILTAFVGLPILSNAIKRLSPLITSISGLFAEGGIFGAGGLIASVSTPILAIAGAISLLAVGLGIVYAKNEEVRESFANAVSVIGENLKPLLEVFTNEILPDLKSGWDGLLQIFKPLGEFLETVFVSIWQDMINPALTYLGETVLPILTETLSNLWNNVFVPLGEFISSVFTPIVEWLSAGLTVLWENVVVPLANALGNILGKAFEGIFAILNKTIIPVVNVVIDVFQFLWNNVLKPIVSFVVSVFGPAFESAFEMIGGIIDGLSKAFGGLIDFITGVFTGDWKKAWNGVKDIFKGVFNGLISIVEGVVNAIVVNGLNNFLKGFNGIVTKIGDVIGIDIEIPQIRKISIPRFETGGFPEDGFFFANHNELVGQFANGKTAVANNEQIVAGIERGVRDANAEQNALLREQNALLRQILAKDTGISTRDVFEAVRTENREYINRNGESAFAF